jgi:hypothetical protein
MVSTPCSWASRLFDGAKVGSIVKVNEGRKKAVVYKSAEKRHPLESALIFNKI